MEHPTDIIFYILPFLIVVVVFFFLRRNKLRGKNLYSSGTPVKLARAIQVENHMSRDEFIAAYKQISSNTGVTKWMRRIFIVVVSLTIINIIAGPFMFKDYKIDYSALIVPCLVFVFWGWALFFSTKNSAGKIYDATMFVKHKAVYTFDADYYKVDSEVTKVQSGWETINGYMETGNLLLIYTGPTQALFIDKNAFAPGDLDELRKFLAANFEVKGGLVIV